MDGLGLRRFCHIQAVVLNDQVTRELPAGEPQQRQVLSNTETLLVCDAEGKAVYSDRRERVRGCDDRYTEVLVGKAPLEAGCDANPALQHQGRPVPRLLLCGDGVADARQAGGLSRLRRQMQLIGVAVNPRQANEHNGVVCAGGNDDVRRFRLLL